MIIDVLSWYVESLASFWTAFASGGLFKALLIWWIVYWIFCRRRRWRWHCRHCHGGCSHCGCHCGHCRCGKGHGHDEEEAAAPA